FMVAYLKGVRFYNDAIRDGHFAGPRAAELIELLVKETRYKDPALYQKIVPNGCDPDGRADRPSLEKDLAFYRANKFVEDDALDGISLDIERGSFCTIVGPSGCGKTTLLRILAGLETVGAGRATIGADDPAKPLNAMVFQGESIFPWMTVWNNAAYGLRMRG